jgi:hypothetical protein
MSVEQTDVVDVIGINGDDVILTISDHLDWDDEPNHLMSLQAKLNSYLSFIESGELLTVCPAAVGKAPVIQVVARVAPNSQGVLFLDQVRSIVTDAGFEFRFRSTAENAS